MIKINISKEKISDDDFLLTLVKIALDKYFNESEEHKQIVKDFSYCEGDYSFKDKDYIVDYDEENEITKKKPIKVISPKAKYIVDTSSALFVGVPPKISTLKNDVEESNKITVFNQKLQLKSFEREIFSVGKDASTCGHGNLLIFTKAQDTFSRFARLDPRSSAVVFDCSAEPESLFAFYITKKQDVDENGNKKEYYYLTVYTDKFVYDMKTTSTTDFTSVIVPRISVDGVEVAKTPHYFGKVPVTRFANNKENKGDAYPVYSLIDAYNMLLSSRLQNVKDIIDYILVLRNVRVGTEEETKSLVDLLKKHKILPIEGEDAEAKFLTNPLNQEQMGSLQKTIEEQIHQISGVPNMSSETFASNASGT
ncbi:MAG: phage portal protein, partial [Candidatus Moranbacteria bacterium]|nr:phage portal protein [Candidatus Moranbacteria bacterium]